MDLLDIEVYGS